MSHSIPDAFSTRMAAQLGDSYSAFMAHYEQPPVIGLRVNTLKLSPEAFAALSPYPLHPIPWAPAGFTVPNDGLGTYRPGRHPYHAAGLYYMQDPAAMAVTTILDPQPGERVLDLAAAPGGKSTHIAARLQGRGVLITNDISHKRAHELAKNVGRWGVRNAAVLNTSAAKLAEHFGAWFDRVVVDAPCSGEGMFRKNDAARAEWSPQAVEKYAKWQDNILHDAAQLVRPGGYIAYATCTYAILEDEGSVARFLAAHPDFSLIQPPMVAGFSAGFAHPDAPETTRAVRLWPHCAVGEGHFVALLRRNGEGGVREAAVAPAVSALPKDERQLFEAFCRETLYPDWLARDYQLTLRGNRLYALPPGLPNLQGLNVVHWGWWLGVVKKNRFEPAHSFAMGLPASVVRHVHALTAEHPDLARFMRGEVIESIGAKGWCLVTVDGYPLSWGKRVNNRIKNHLPQWLRFVR